MIDRLMRRVFSRTAFSLEAHTGETVLRFSRRAFAGVLGIALFRKPLTASELRRGSQLLPSCYCCAGAQCDECYCNYDDSICPGGSGCWNIGGECCCDCYDGITWCECCLQC
jgi:hypothetical protein